jgi:RHS repeat-associated protein
MTVTVNFLDAHHITVTNVSCSTNDGLYPNLWISVYYSTDFKTYTSMGAIGVGQTTSSIPSPCWVQISAIHYVTYPISFDYVENGSSILNETAPQNSGYNAQGKLATSWWKRLKGYIGGPVQLATGAECADRPLFSFHGARDWSFGLHYNSILAAEQITQTSFGFGWTDDFESNIIVNGSSLLLHWDATSFNTFNPVPGNPNTYTSTEDGARYDTIIAQSGGGWLLVRKDQSSRLFNASGQLTEDIDTHGRVLQLSYESGTLSEIVEPISNTFLLFSYDDSGTVSSIVDSSDATVYFGYTTVTTPPLVARVLATITNQNGYAVAFSYIACQALYSETDSQGNTLTQNIYDTTSGCVAMQVEGNGTYNITRDEEGTMGEYWNTAVNVTDRDGIVTQYNYDANFNLVMLVGFGGNSARPEEVYTYDANNQITSGGFRDRISQYTYDSTGNLLTSTDPLGNVTTFTYDSRNNLLSITDAAGQITVFTYDSRNNLLTLTNAASGTTTWSYDGNSLPLTRTLPRGGVFQYAYTSGLLTQVTDPNGVINTFSYDGNGRLLYRADALGNKTQFTYDALGNVLTCTNPLNQTFTFTYDYRNRISSLKDPAGQTTAYTYDIDNNLLTKTDALGNVTKYTYDPEDRLTQIVDALNRTTNIANDEAGRIQTITDPANWPTTFYYGYDAGYQGGTGDNNNSLTTVIDAFHQSTTIIYDDRGLPISITDPLSRKKTTTYDNVGRPLTSVDPLSRTTQFVYDALRRLSQVTDPGGLVAKQGFDADSNRTSITDSASNAAGFVFDGGGRLTSATTPGGKTTNLTYDARGLPLSVTQPSGNATTFAYDNAARLSSATDGVGTRSITRDSLGRILTVAENGKTLSRNYDSLGRLSSFVDGAGNVIGYQYDNIGRLTTLTYPGGNQVTYAYDTAGNLSTVTDWANRITTYVYDGDHHLTNTTRPDGTTESRSYDAAGQLVQLTDLAPDGVTVIYSGTYTYDAAGQLTNETTVPALMPAPANATQTFDADNRLLTHNGAATTFDPNGNLLAIASGVTPASYTYDARNRLTAAGALTYTYDAENHRVALADSTGTTNFIVNPNGILDQVLIRTTPDGTVTYYVYGLGLAEEVSGSAVHYYHTDYRGNTIALTGSTGSVTDTASYDTYGALVSHTGTTNTPFLFNGRWGVQSDSNGIYYSRARYYHPGLRRFLNQDIVLGRILSPASLNRFAYANGNPVSFIDPFGLAAQDISSAANLALATYLEIGSKLDSEVAQEAAFLNTGLLEPTNQLILATLSSVGQQMAGLSQVLADKGIDPIDQQAFAAYTMQLEIMMANPSLLSQVTQAGNTTVSAIASTAKGLGNTTTAPILATALQVGSNALPGALQAATEAGPVEDVVRVVAYAPEGPELEQVAEAEQAAIAAVKKAKANASSPP